MRTWRVAILCNQKANVTVDASAPKDALVELDSAETIQSIQAAIQSLGHVAFPLEADPTLVDTIRQTAPDICFNIAEGLWGDARESHAPALLEMLGIPYTGSKVLTHALSLDKVAAKRIWRDVGLPTAPFQVFQRGDEPLDPTLEFPLFVKPAREGSGMGINNDSLVHDETALRRQVEWVIQTYRQPALVEIYLPGREFTVGLLGNTRKPGDPLPDSLYNERGFHLFPVLEIDANVGVGHGLYHAEAKSYIPGEKGAPLYLCPADIPARLRFELEQLTMDAFEALGSLDVGRVDFRLGRDGRPYVMEINTLPGLNPTVSDFCIIARAEGIQYSDLITQILHLAADRYGLSRIDQRDWAFQRQPAGQTVLG